MSGLSRVCPRCGSIIEDSVDAETGKNRDHVRGCVLAGKPASSLPLRKEPLMIITNQKFSGKAKRFRKVSW